MFQNTGNLRMASLGWLNWFSEGTTRKKCGKLREENIGCVSA